MKLIAPFYPDKSTLARAWVEALEALPGHHHRAGSFEYRQSLLSRDGRYKPKEVSGTFTFRPDSGAGFSQWQGSAVETPADILELNTLLKAVVYRLMEEYRTARLEARTFKILVHNGWYVDTMMLPKGIYSSITPQLYQPTATIQELVDEAKKMKRRGIDIGGYIENVKRCQLKVVELSV